MFRKFFLLILILTVPARSSAALLDQNLLRHGHIPVQTALHAGSAEADSGFFAGHQMQDICERLKGDNLPDTQAK